MTTEARRAQREAEYQHAAGALPKYADKTYVLEKAGRRGDEPREYFAGIERTVTGKAARFTRDREAAGWFSTRTAEWYQAMLQDHYGVHVYAIEIERPRATEPVEFDPREAVEAESDLEAGQAVGRG